MPRLMARATKARINNTIGMFVQHSSVFKDFDPSVTDVDQTVYSSRVSKIRIDESDMFS